MATPSHNQLTAHILAALQQGLTLHQQGKLAEAKAIYEVILKHDPRHFDSLNLLGAIAAQTGKYQAAVDLIGEAISINPNVASAYNNRGNALLDLKRLDEALANYDKALALKPDYAEAHCNRGSALLDLNRLDEALASCNKALDLNPNYAEGYNNRGNVLLNLKRFNEALACYDKALTLNPDYAEAYYNRGNSLRDLKQPDKAVASYDRALALKPDNAEAYYNRGSALKDLKRPDEAMASYSKALSLKPDYAEAYYNLGNVLRDLKLPDRALASYNKALATKPDYAEAYIGRGDALLDLKQPDKALASYDKALAINPSYAEAYYNRGIAFQTLRRLDAAIGDFDQAIAIKPNFAEAYWIKSFTLLLGGDFEKGWELFEWRWLLETATPKRRCFIQPLWLGVESLKGKSILLHSEQGLGDTIQFCRYAELVAQLGATVILEVQPPLLELLRGLKGVFKVVAEGETLPPVDYHCPLMSLPLAFRTTLGTIPADIPYVKAEPSRAAYWRTKLGGHSKLHVGLVWSGGFRPNQPEVWDVNKRRNIPLELIARINSPEIDFYSLQKGEPAESELLRRKEEVWPETNLFNFVQELNDFSDTAALIENLDLVISVDTSTAHLAAAMGKPVWILNRYDSCWRWLLDRDDSPWYPTAKLYRQQRMGDWESVLDHVKTDLSKVALPTRTPAVEVTE
jgi:tetratricopeptide (TPR) repeat protein